MFEKFSIFLVLMKSENAVGTLYKGMRPVFWILRTSYTETPTKACSKLKINIRNGNLHIS